MQNAECKISGAAHGNCKIYSLLFFLSSLFFSVFKELIINNKEEIINACEAYPSFLLQQKGGGTIANGNGGWYRSEAHSEFRISNSEFKMLGRVASPTLLTPHSSLLTKKNRRSVRNSDFKAIEIKLI